MKTKKVLYSLYGNILISFAVSFFRLANLGTDPFTTFNLGFSFLFNIRYGTFLVISSLIAVVFIFFANRSLIGIGTIFNMFIVGNLSDLLVSLYTTNFGTLDNLLVRMLFTVLGILVLSIGAALYIEAKEGVAPYDAIPIIIQDKTPLTYRTAKVTLDVSLTIIGFSLGAVVGVNTLITAFFLGPIIQFFRELFEEKLNTDELDYSTKK
ncbi:YczE/YyaS/YitT family protein [Lacticigenium naphthae]|uniref:YczE/YyaS/YitT family protein n=1 Tax=Lacticigenium naphthae TaxID=515351 RepID=UPI00041A3DD4|nr:hypothetical protein [Lacticigenium naphthae]